MLYPKPALTKILRGNTELIKKIWKAFNDIPLEALLGEGRVYGGGPHKLEPKELGNVPADALYTLVPELLRGHVEQMSLL